VAYPGLIDIMISTNYTTGTDPTTATWTAFAFDKTIYGNLTTSADLDFSAYDGATVHVGLKYSSTATDLVSQDVLITLVIVLHQKITYLHS